MAAVSSVSAFIPVVVAPMGQTPPEFTLDITLANGIRADVRSITREEIAALLAALSALP